MKIKDLGTPNEKIWPGWKELPLAKKLNFPDFPYNTLRSRFGTYLSDKGFELINKYFKIFHIIISFFKNKCKHT